MNKSSIVFGGYDKKILDNGVSNIKIDETEQSDDETDACHSGGVQVGSPVCCEGNGKGWIDCDSHANVCLWQWMLLVLLGYMPGC